MVAEIIVKSIIYNRDLNRILLIQRSDNDHVGAGTWENAGGKIEAGETPEEAVIREASEETGITDLRIKNIAYLAVLSGELPDLLVVYLCETQTEAVKLSFEHQAYIWADEQQCRELLPKPILSDFENNHIFEMLHGKQNV